MSFDFDSFRGELNVPAVFSALLSPALWVSAVAVVDNKRARRAEGVALAPFGGSARQALDGGVHVF